ncbi:MAG: LLM class flavin-dependent oxidoreductase, partial [Brevundimonas sp.]
MIPFSVLDLSPIVEGGDVRRGLDETLALAQAADRLGYERFWL